MAKDSAKPPAGRRGGFRLLREIYDELYRQLGEEFSPAELLRAAQALIDITNEEYASERFQDGRVHSGYYSFAVDHMIREREWWLLEVETMPWDVADDVQSNDREARQRFKLLYNPDPYYHRG